MAGDPNITLSQIKEMVFALPAEHWLIRLRYENDTPPPGVHRAIKDRYHRKTLIGAQAMDTARFFRWQNAQGYNVYGRPDATHYILVDDLCIDALDTMHSDGVNTPVVVQTSKGNFQAWIKVAVEPIATQEAHACSRLLAERYGGDKGAVAAKQLGRFPGLTNRKEIHLQGNGLPPFTALHKPAMRFRHPACATHVLDEARAALASASAFSFTPAAACVPLSNDQPDLLPSEAAALYNDTAQWLFTRFGKGAYEKPDGAIDRSRLDYAVARHFAIGGMSEEDCAAVLMSGSEKAQERGTEYVKGTVGKLFANNRAFIF